MKKMESTNKRPQIAMRDYSLLLYAVLFACFSVISYLVSISHFGIIPAIFASFSISTLLVFVVIMLLKSFPKRQQADRDQSNRLSNRDAEMVSALTATIFASSAAILNKQGAKKEKEHNIE